MFSRQQIAAYVIGPVLLMASAACSIPNLETAECIEARPAVREFYSFHFGHEMEFSPEGLEAREIFLTPEFAERLKKPGVGGDPFTIGNGDLPRAFRAGRCETVEDSRVKFSILVFWKDDERTEQREVKVKLKKVDDKWLIDNVKN